MKTIELTHGQVAKVSDGWFDELNKFKWQAQWSADIQSFYVVRNIYKPFRKTILMHRVIAGTPDNMICDHVNHDTLDNQDDNLRNVTRSQNQMNRKMFRNNKLGEKDISVRGSKFRVQVKKHGKNVFDKTYSTMVDAVMARNEAVKKLHGEFGYNQE